MGIKGAALERIVQNIHSLAAISLSIPSRKNISIINRNGIGFYALIGIITLAAGTGSATVGIIIHIAVIFGRCDIINAVYVHIRLAESAAKQVASYLITRSTPQRKRTDQLIAGYAPGNCLMECAAGVKGPARTTVIGKQDQRVKLILLQIKAITVNDALVDIPFDRNQIIAKKDLSLVFCDAMLGVILHHVIRAARAITDCILRKIPNGRLTEAFFDFQNLYTLITCNHIGCRADGENASGNHSNQHYQRNQ